MELLNDNLYTAPLIRALRSVGADVNPEVMAETLELYRPFHQSGPGRVTRNARYGPDQRHVCDIFSPAEPDGRARPLIIFVHGGGFVRGDKEIVQERIYDNVGWWAVRNDFIGVTMNYRLAPGHKWPAGGDDVGSLIDWLAGNALPCGGKPDRLIVVGHSAGASHVATCLARLDRLGPAREKVAAAVLCSGLYDVEALSRAGRVPTAYFGTDKTQYADMSSSHRLAALNIPLLVTINEFEPTLFQEQGESVAIRMHSASADVRVRYAFLSGHNHFSCVFNVNLPVHDLLGMHMAAFVNSVL
ncbi:acetyl esterase/lipase [Paraburkholderia sp. RAU6.4a]|uniref:alpha/beta hydrolase n=1 Tax=Paraburkholderia sp. RAU6.4a TaxID=2991067 RepID=UPI003D1F015C